MSVWDQFSPQAPTTPWDQFQKIERPTATVDALKSLGIGVAKAGVGLAGLPGDIGSLARLGAETVGVPKEIIDRTGKVIQYTPFLSAFTGPGSQDIQKQVESVTGEFYKPQTVAGEYAEKIGEFGPAALFPGGAVRRAVNVLAPALGSESAGQLTKGSAIEPYAEVAGALAGGILGARGITPAAATMERRQLANVLQREGVPMTAGQRTGSRPMQWFEQAAADTPIAAGRAAQMNEATGRAFTGAVMRRMGASGNDLATPQAIDLAVRNLGQRFNDISARNVLSPDRRMVSDLVDTAQQYINAVIPSQRVQGRQNIETIMQDIVETMNRNGGTMSGQMYQATRSRLGSMADGVRESDPQLSQAIRGIRNALDDAMSRSITPADRAEWQTLRTQWKNWKAIGKAASGAGSATAEGFISPSQLRTAVAGQGREAYTRGRGDLAELARAGEALLRPLPQSGTAPRAAAANAFASLAGMVGGSAAGGFEGAVFGAMAPALAGRAMLSPPVQAYLGNQALPVTGREMLDAAMLNAALSRPRPPAVQQQR